MKVSKATAYALHALMYMVRHITQLPATSNTIARAEGIPPGYMAKIFQRLVKAHFVKAVKGREKGYVFAKPPEEISLLELFEAVENGPLFNDCLLRHCQCGGTPENCYIYAQWKSTTKGMSKIFTETSLAAAAWNHPEHRFYALPESLETVKRKPREKATKPKAC
jgi:Rrf2 family protein